ncbi:MAG: IS66 family transposase [Paludibacterium sp.]|uniref:IS66 family transposase n=1 Tax=Paludibacterium sp. TaxID=1917523 RepID=UPI0025F8238D|nr:IS66 family transposase [Paludibacterium sp.]MBV8049288.1 IS66 family transposase [Paludibacterium sp.]
MPNTPTPRPLSHDEAAALTPQQVVGLSEQVVDLSDRLNGLQQQLDWFRRHVFGQKSEKRPLTPDEQLSLSDLFLSLPEKPLPGKAVAAHTRQPASRKQDEGESLPFFDRERVPVEMIEVANPDMAGLSSDQYEVIGFKDSYRLAQRPGSYVVLQYRRPLIKRLDTQQLSCPPAPVGVLEGSRADVSFLAGLMVDKCAYHLPLYRQHQKLLDAGFTLSRQWLTQLFNQGAALLEPIYEAQLASIRAGRVIAMDETPIKAGLAGAGKMKATYFWPVYGEGDEICFPHFESRRHEHVQEVLGVKPGADKVLLTDGYAAYAAYAKQNGVTHAQCWTHCRRGFFEAQEAEPEAAAAALKFIGALYAVEETIREQKLKGEKKREYRLDHAKPVVERFFAWVAEQFERQGLLPRNPLTKALNYARERRSGLEVYLADPDVPIDTNHLERGLRVIPMGRRNWNFCWTELGARQIGIVQSLIATCRLHGLSPYDYLVDVLQRVGQQPAAEVAQLTPRQWKTHFAANPLRSDLSKIPNAQ